MKAFDMSSFSITAASLSACSRRAMLCTSMKLSWMDLSLTKALWCMPTIFGSSLANLLARILFKIFIAPRTKLTGLNQVGLKTGCQSFQSTSKPVATGKQSLWLVQQKVQIGSANIFNLVPSGFCNVCLTQRTYTIITSKDATASIYLAKLSTLVYIF